MVPESFTFLTRILYQAPSCGAWGEHEGAMLNRFAPFAHSAVDYILFLQKDVQIIDPNPNEVMAVRYVTPQELRDMFDTAGAPLFD